MTFRTVGKNCRETEANRRAIRPERILQFKTITLLLPGLISPTYLQLLHEEERIRSRESLARSSTASAFSSSRNLLPSSPINLESAYEVPSRVESPECACASLSGGVEYQNLRTNHVCPGDTATSASPSQKLAVKPNEEAGAVTEDCDSNDGNNVVNA